MENTEIEREVTLIHKVDNILMSCTPVGSYFLTEKDLKELALDIKETLKGYKKLGLTTKKINQKNEEIDNEVYQLDKMQGGRRIKFSKPKSSIL